MGLGDLNVPNIQRMLRDSSKPESQLESWSLRPEGGNEFIV